MRRALLLGSALLACSPAQSSAPPSPPTASPAPAPKRRAPAAPGPCQIRHEGFSGVTVTDLDYEDGAKVRAIERGPAGERQTLWSYDASGRRTRQVVVDGASIRTHTFEYEDGVLVHEAVHDAKLDRIVVRRTRTYGPGATLRARDESRWHDGRFLVVDQHALHYDKANRFAYELRTRTPIDGPKTVYSITVDVDERGRVIARRVDEGMTGSFEQVSLYDYAEHGGLATATQMKGDAVDSVARHTYDAQARLIRTQVEDGAGKAQSVTTYAFSCPS